MPFPASDRSSYEAILTGILGAFVPGREPPRRTVETGRKLRASIRDAVLASGLRSGGTVSFHHHYRNGDHLLPAVIEVLAGLGLHDLTLAASSIFPIHTPLVPYLANRTVSRIVTSYLKGPVADFVRAGGLAEPIILQSHGGRARAIASGQMRIDLAVIGASLASERGDATGRAGAVACGPLGYGMVDAAHARQVLVVADRIADVPAKLIDIPAEQVDHVVELAGMGDPAGILSGVTVPLDTLLSRQIGSDVVKLVEAAGLLMDGFSFQTGSGGYSLGAVPILAEALAARGCMGDFISGGIIGAHVDIVRRGLMRRIRDVQSFDLAAAESSSRDAWHSIMSAEEYASPNYPAAVNDLSVMIVGAAEVDRHFNVNVAVGGDGRIIGGPGGHPDASTGAKLTIVTTPAVAGSFQKVVDQVSCCVTPGEVVDAVVTDQGVSINPTRSDLIDACNRHGVAVVPIENLVEKARTSLVAPHVGEGRCIAIVEHRLGHVLDVIRAE